MLLLLLLVAEFEPSRRLWRPLCARLLLLLARPRRRGCPAAATKGAAAPGEARSRLLRFSAAAEEHSRH